MDAYNNFILTLANSVSIEYANTLGIVTDILYLVYFGTLFVVIMKCYKINIIIASHALLMLYVRAIVLVDTITWICCVITMFLPLYQLYFASMNKNNPKQKRYMQTKLNFKKVDQL
jgi:hypothetical protein